MKNENKIIDEISRFNYSELYNPYMSAPPEFNDLTEFKLFLNNIKIFFIIVLILIFCII